MEANVFIYILNYKSMWIFYTELFQAEKSVSVFQSLWSLRVKK